MTTAAQRLCNLRDLGGLATTDGGATRTGVLYRSEVPLAGDVRPDEVPIWPPGTVLDLRAPTERREVANPLNGSGAVVHSLPVLDDSAMSAARATSWPADAEVGAWFSARYTQWLTERASIVARALTLAATCPLPLLVHCSAGRDRTGVIAALLLGAANVQRDAIIADYRRTEGNHRRLMARLIDRGVLNQRHDTRLANRSLATPEAIETVLDRLQGHPDGISGWLHANDVPPTTVDKWRTRITNRPSSLPATKHW